MVGGEAVKAADEGDTGMMVILNRISNDPYACGTKIKDPEIIFSGSEMF